MLGQKSGFFFWFFLEESQFPSPALYQVLDKLNCFSKRVGSSIVDLEPPNVHNFRDTYIAVQKENFAYREIITNQDYAQM